MCKQVVAFVVGIQTVAMECNFFLQFSGSLPSATGKALGKDFSKKNIYNFFAECLAVALGKVFFFKKIQKFFSSA